MGRLASISGIRCPTGLNEYGKLEFYRLRDELPGVGYTMIDQGLLYTYLTAFGIMREAADQIRKHGLTIQTPNGSTQISPYHSIYRNNAELVRRCAVDLGFTPAARKKLLGSMAVDSGPDELEGFQS